MSDDNPYAAIARAYAEARDSDAPLNERLRILADAVSRMAGTADTADLRTARHLLAAG